MSTLRKQWQRKDHTGKRFGQLLVVQHSEGRNWLCLCDCGRETIVDRGNFKVTKSCGCLRRKVLVDDVPANHLKTKTKVHNAWLKMFRRCRGDEERWYDSYTKRGITVCERWKSFELFYADVGDPPTIDHSLDRIDPNGNYEPGNVRWATHTTQMRNTTRNRYLTFNGETHCCSEWAEITGLTSSAILSRLGYGWTIEKTLTTPKRGTKNSL